LASFWLSPWFAPYRGGIETKHHQVTAVMAVRALDRPPQPTALVSMAVVIVETVVVVAIEV
jgi:hypothetical protein